GGAREPGGAVRRVNGGAKHGGFPTSRRQSPRAREPLRSAASEAQPFVDPPCDWPRTETAHRAWQAVRGPTPNRPPTETDRPELSRAAGTRWLPGYRAPRRAAEG